MSRAAFDQQQLQPSGSAERPRMEGQPRQRCCFTPWGLLPGLPAGRQSLESPRRLCGLESVNVTLPILLIPIPAGCRLSTISPTGHTRGKGRLFMPSASPRADTEPSWAPSLVALTPCPWMAQEMGSKQGDKHQRFLCHRLIKI